MSNSVFKVKRLIQWCIDLVDVSLGVFTKKKDLVDTDFVENSTLIENSKKMQ